MRPIHLQGCCAVVLVACADGDGLADRAAGVDEVSAISADSAGLSCVENGWRSDFGNVGDPCGLDASLPWANGRWADVVCGLEDAAALGWPERGALPSECTATRDGFSCDLQAAAGTVVLTGRFAQDRNQIQGYFAYHGQRDGRACEQFAGWDANASG